MKKTIICITILAILLMTVFTGTVYADTLDDFSVSVDKKLIHPNENVVLTVTFGKPLGTFTIKVDFDDDIFEYVSTENGTGNAEGDKVTVEYNESTTTKDDTKITFKAKEGLKTSNPTDFTVTGSNLKSENGTTTYEDSEYGKVYIVASSKNLECGTIIRFNSARVNPDGDVLAIVLDRGVVGTALDLLTPSEDYASKYIGRSSITYDVLRNGWAPSES